MKIGRRFLTICISIILILIVAEFYYYSNYTTKKEPVFNISLIVYGNSTDRWENLKQGAERAADGTSAEINLITMSSDLNAKEQISLINREIENGADALMIAACDSEKIEEYFKGLSVKIPVVFVQNGFEDNTDTWYISADNYAMGHTLGNVIAANEKSWIKAAIISDRTERKNVADRFDGVYDSLVQYADEVVIWERNENERDSQTMLFLQRELTEEAVDVVVALDTSSMEALMDAIENLNKNIKVYGIANSDKAVYYLDNGKIKALIFQNEFSIGYLGVKVILNETAYNKKRIFNLIKYETVNKDNMYSEEYQKLLFPFVK
ncbi:MAG TPA: substrate-binding domain-containing protein [Lachnospiraceae bacterium]|nr:substrate-binding domain-containing protein [Lachnospiraceae bacterium]